MQTVVHHTAQLARALANRARDQRGQISAEFMGLLFIAALVIGAIVALDIHTLISEAVEQFINDIKSGDKPEGS
jgi:Na+/citrate or Na+/malate symporter